jgi:hypothetical protein
MAVPIERDDCAFRVRSNRNRFIAALASMVTSCDFASLAEVAVYRFE